MRKGIAVAGTIVADVIKTIDRYPEQGMLASVTDMHKAVGGCVPNTSIDLAVIDPKLAVYALGCVGDDENGRFIRDKLCGYGVDVSYLEVSRHATGFSDVMTVRDTGARTFFTSFGANRAFDLSPEFIEQTNVRILHTGYITMLGRADEPDEKYGTVLARRLCEAQRKGILTSVDLVGTEEKTLREKATCALAYCDYAVMNESEACAVAGLSARDGTGKLNAENVCSALRLLMQAGVKRAVVVHSPEAGFICTEDGKTEIVPSLMLPSGFIRGSVGAGDAFCAACLYGLYTEMRPREILEFASAAAACNLSAADAISGMRPQNEIMEIMKKYPRRTI